jgi:hypothetical protein
MGSKVLPALQGQYKNLDTRAVFVKSKNKSQWDCTFLKVYFTRDSKGTIEEIHEEKCKLTSLKDNNLKFVSECIDINEAVNLLKEINNKKITIDGITATLQPYSQNIFDPKTKLSMNKTPLELYMLGSQLIEYPHAFIVLDSNETPYTLLADRGFDFKDHAYRNLNVETNTFLDTPHINSSNCNGIIIFPIYWKQLKLDSNEQLTYVSKFELHSSLLAHCEPSICYMKNSTVIKRIDNSSLKQKQSDDMTIFYVLQEDVNIQKDSRLHIEIDFPNIEQQLEYELRYDDIISKDKIQTNPLSFIFKLLTNANHNLPLYVNSDIEKQQVVGTTWLLSMLGFRHLNVGIINTDDERVYDGKIEKGAVDTLAFDENIGTLVIDFTNSPPKWTKVDKIRNSARYIYEKLSISGTPVIICNKCCLDTKTSVSDVVIIDKNDTDKLIKLISNNKIEQAKQSFYDIVNHIEQIGEA